MSVTTAIAIYFIVWWVTLFAVLPFGIRSQHESGDFEPGTDPGAPVMAGIGMKLIWTTIVSAVVFALLWANYNYGVITLDGLAGWMGMRR